MYTCVEPAPASLDVTASGQADYVAEASVRPRRVSVENLSVGTDRGKPGRGRWPVATSITRSRTSDTPSQENQPAINTEGVLSRPTTVEKRCAHHPAVR